MNPPNPQTPPKKPLIILDTNIFGYLLDEANVPQITVITNDLSAKHELSISDFTGYELVRLGSKDVKKLLGILTLFRGFVIDKNVLVFAGLMSCLGVEKDGDSIVAATAFLNTAMILTANHSDYPEPFFHEVRYWHMDSKTNKNRTKTTTIHLLEVDLVKVADGMNKVEYVKEAKKQPQAAL